MSEKSEEGARAGRPAGPGAEPEAPAGAGRVPAGAGGRPKIDELRRRLSELGDPLWVLTNLFVFAPTPLLVYGADGRCLLANDAFRRVAGAEPAADYGVLAEGGEAGGPSALVRRAFAGEALHLPTAWYAPGAPLLPAAGPGRRVALEASLVPLRDGAGRVAFVLGLFHDRTDELLAKERLETQARQRGEDATLHETLYRIGAALNAGLELSAVVQRLTDEATALCGASFGAFFYNVADDRGESYMLYTLSGVGREHFEKFPMPRNTGVFAPTFAGESVVRSDDITRDPRYAHNPPHRGMPEGHLPVRSYLAVPVVARSGEVLGGLFLGHPEAGVFTARDERLLAAVAPQAAIAIDNARLLQDARRARASAEAELRERERLEGELRAQMRLTKAIADNATTALFVTDERRQCTFMNPAAEAMTGFTLEEVRARGEPLHDVIHYLRPDGRPFPAAECPIDRALPGGARERGEDAFVHRGGRIFPVAFTASPLLDGERQLGTVLEVQDITERRRREGDLEALARASTRLGSSLELGETLRELAGCFVPERADWSNVYLRRDDGALELAACAHSDPAREGPLRELVGRFLAEGGEHFGPARVLRTQRAELVSNVEAEARRRAEGGETGPLRALRELGAASALTVPLLRDGRAVGALAAVSVDPGRRYDQADLIWAEELARRAVAAVDNARLFDLAQRERRRAEEANRAKDEFLAVVSHELRTPLTAILGWAKMLGSGSLDGPQSARAMATIERNALAQAQLVEDLLDVSRITTGKLKIAVGPVDVVRAIEAALEVVRPAAEAKGVRLQPILDHHAGPLLGDADRLQQVVWTLLSNAVKFTPRGGRVVVRLERADSACVVTVEDTGRGIEPAFLPYVFERFRQAEAATTRAHGGLGLGLAIARHLAELHGGTVEARSEGAGRGATFVVRLPIAPLRRASSPTLAPAASAPGPGSPAPAGLPFECPPAVEGLRVLVVDDEPDARELLTSLLEHCRAEVRAAPGAAEALGLLRSFRPDVLVSDVSMPGEDGYVLLEKVRALPDGEGGRTPAIALTAYARTEDRTRALLAGFTMHVPKPIDPSELLVVVANVAGKLGPRRG